MSIDGTIEHVIQVNGEDHSMKVQKATVTGFVKSTNNNTFSFYVLQNWHNSSLFFLQNTFEN